MRSPLSAVALGLLGAVFAITSVHAGCGGDTVVGGGTGATTSAASTSASSPSSAIASSGAGGARASSASSAVTSSGAGGASASTSSSSATTSSGKGGASASTSSSSATTSSGAGGASGTGGATTPYDAGSGPTCAPAAFLQAGPAWEGDAEVPIYHRAAPACCPTQRGPGPQPQPYPSGEAEGCSKDSQCNQGPDGRCWPFGGLAWSGGCWYDQCFTDSDCPSGAPCICRVGATDNSANVCAVGGNCVLDSDCGPGGFCSPSVFCTDRAPGWGTWPYYCHTPADTCINDSDCPPNDAGSGCDIPSVCLYDGQKWACNTTMKCCPP